MNPLASPRPTPRSTRFLLALLPVLLLILPGCETTAPTAAAPQLTVQAARSPRLDATPTTAAAPHAFTLRFVNAKTQALIQPHLSPLLDALSRQGFTPARRDQSPDTTVWVAAIENIQQEVQVGSMQGPPVADNPDSVRYKNTAAMFGRYNKLMHDDRYGAGEMMIGPEGEVIMTGNLGSSAADEASFQPNVPTRTVLRQRNVLAIWATDTAPPQNAEDDGELWRVEVMTDQPAPSPAPAFATLVDTALQHLAQDSNGLQTLPLPNP